MTQEDPGRGKPVPTAAAEGRPCMGVVYMTWGRKAIDEAEQSAASLWRHAPEMPVLIVGDGEAERHFAARDRFQFTRVDVDPFASDGAHGFMAGRIKPLLAELSPFEWSLYVDADTDFQSSPAWAFELLRRWDVVVAETETRSLVDTIAGRSESTQTAEWLGTPHILYHNSGMLFWRRNEATAGLFRLWSEEWLRYGQWDEQVALLRALLRSQAVFLTAPFTWNCREGRKAFLLHHRFGTKAARKFTGTGGHVRDRSHVRPPVERAPLVRVEVMPGRFVRCRPGDEAGVVARYRFQMMPHQDRVGGA